MDTVRCPVCERINEGVLEFDGIDSSPRAGDRTVCFWCLSVTVFTGNGLECRRQTEAEEIEALFDRRINDARSALAHFRRP